MYPASPGLLHTLSTLSRLSCCPESWCWQVCTVPCTQPAQDFYRPSLPCLDYLVVLSHDADRCVQYHVPSQGLLHTLSTLSRLPCCPESWCWQVCTVPCTQPGTSTHPLYPVSSRLSVSYLSAMLPMSVVSSVQEDPTVTTSFTQRCHGAHTGLCWINLGTVKSSPGPGCRVIRSSHCLERSEWHF